MPGFTIFSAALLKLKSCFSFFRKPHQHGHIPVPTLNNYIIWERLFQLSEVIETLTLTFEMCWEWETLHIAQCVAPTEHLNRSGFEREVESRRNVTHASVLLGLVQASPDVQREPPGTLPASPEVHLAPLPLPWLLLSYEYLDAWFIFPIWLKASPKTTTKNPIFIILYFSCM